jgi:agmatine/peptidylarginine deiminase
MLRILWFLLIVLLASSASFGQITGLPIWQTQDEERLIPEYVISRPGASRGITTPPGIPVRTMAEWEEIQAVVVTWTQYTSIVREIVRYAREECQVLIVCNDSLSVRNNLLSNGIPLTNISYIQRPYNSIWIRDYGANTVYGNEVDSLMLVDWIYNRPRPLDDVIPDAVGGFFNVPVFSTTTPPYDLVHTGGNFMSDGLGTAFSSKLVLDENGPSGNFNPTDKTEAQIDTLMKEFMGIERYAKMENLPYDGIHHIDMHMKLLDEETLLVGEYPAGVADGPQIEANLQYVLNNYQSAFGSPYKVLRIQMPPEAGKYPWNGGDYRTYTNSIFLNKTLLVPVYQEQFDTTALRILREQLPGYRVIGINCNQIIPAGGALHCITKAVGVKDPLFISHQPLEDQSFAGPFTINATLRHRSGISSASVFYTTDTTAGFLPVNMALTDTLNQIWSADIPSQIAGTEVFYFVHAAAFSGKQQARPITAPDGYWNFRIMPSTGLADETEWTATRIDAVFPNPASGLTCIALKAAESGMAKIRLMDVLGREVLQIFDGNVLPGERKFFFDASGLPSATYLLLLETGNGSEAKRVLVR